MKLSKWGDSLAIRLPAAQLESLGFKLGDELISHEYDGGLLLKKKITDKDKRFNELEERVEYLESEINNIKDQAGIL